MKPVAVDIIILSYAKSEALRSITEQTIATLVASENSEDINFNVVVIESNSLLKPFKYANSTTIYPDTAFGFNKYLNIGINVTTSPYLCLCNNDLIFHKHWATNILREMEFDEEIKSANPYCPITHSGAIPDNGKNIFSTENGTLIGWCIFLKREVVEITGLLDEQFRFWYADNDYGRTLKLHQIKHALVTSAKVTHLGSKTHETLAGTELFDFTYGQFLYFDLKWNHQRLLVYRLQKVILPLFKYLYLKRQASKYPILLKVLSKLYGGLR